MASQLYTAPSDAPAKRHALDALASVSALLGPALGQQKQGPAGYEASGSGGSTPALLPHTPEDILGALVSSSMTRA
jgi:hypothetical protein